MTLCSKCDSPLDIDSERIGDEIYCRACIETIRAANADYEAVMATWREDYSTEKGQ